MISVDIEATILLAVDWYCGHCKAKCISYSVKEWIEKVATFSVLFVSQMVCQDNCHVSAVFSDFRNKYKHLMIK